MNYYRAQLNFGADTPLEHGFDYQAGNLYKIGVNVSGVPGPAYAKTMKVMITWRESSTDRQKVLDHVRAFIRSAAYPSDGTDEQKLTAIDNYICSIFSYDSTLQNVTPASMIASTKGVCQAYAMYGYLMLTEAGYATRIILNRYDDAGTKYMPDAKPYGSGHAWLLVKVGAKWYHMDFTWNDPASLGSGSTRNYYMKSDSQMSYDHRWTSPAGTSPAYYPAATSTWAGVPVSPTPSPVATATPTPRPTSSATPTPKPTATPVPTKAPTRAPTPTVASTPTSVPVNPPPTVDPTAIPIPSDAATTPSTAATTAPTAAPPATTAPTATDAPPLLVGSDRVDPAPSFGQQAFDAIQMSWTSTFPDATPEGTVYALTGGTALLLLLLFLLSRRLRNGRSSRR